MVKLSPEQQDLYTHANPEVFRLANSAWGRQGATIVHLRLAKRGVLRDALAAAWRNAAPKQLVRDDEA